MYPEEIVKPMKEELTTVGFQELLSPEDVETALSNLGTSLVVVNSVCGCAAANARPAVRISLNNKSTPDHYIQYLQEWIVMPLTPQGPR